MLLLSIFVIFESINYYNAINQRMATAFDQSPGFFPAIIGFALLACSILLLVRSIKGVGVIGNLNTAKEGAVSFLKSPVALKSLIGCSWMGIYIFALLPQFGFVVGSMMFLIVLIVFLELPTLKTVDSRTAAISVVKYVVISGITVGLTAGLFQGIFRVPLP